MNVGDKVRLTDEGVNFVLNDYHQRNEACPLTAEQLRALVGEVVSAPLYINVKFPTFVPEDVWLFVEREVRIANADATTP